MGLFGSKTKTYYNTSTMPIYDEKVAGMLKQTVLSATATNRSIGSSLLENILNSNVGNLGRLHRFAASGQYEWGLPDQVERYLPPKTVENIKLIIQNDVAGEPVTLSYYIFDSFINPDVDKDWTIPNTPNLPEAPPLPSNKVVDRQGYDWYYVVEYALVSAPTEYIKWWFRESDATNEYYSFLQMEKLTTNPYYPIIPFRVDRERMDNDPRYEGDIRRACNYLGINSRVMGNNIQDISDSNEANGNPNPMEDAYLFMGIPLNTQEQIGKEYLYRFFHEMYKTSKITEGDFLQWENSSAGRSNFAVPPRNSITIKDINFENVFSWTYIKRYTEQGNVTDEKGRPFKTTGYVVEFDEKERQEYGNSFASGSILRCKRQNVGNTITVLEIVGIGFSSVCVGKEMYYTLEEAFEVEDDNQDGEKVVVPLHKDVLKKMGTIRGHDLLNIAIRMQLNDKVRIKQKRSWFSIVVIIIAVVVTILYPPAGGWTMSSAMAAIGINIAISLVMKLLSPAITKVLQDVFGEELGALLAVVAMYIMARGMSNAMTPTPAGSAATAKVPAAKIPESAISVAGITITAVQQVNLAMNVANAYIAVKHQQEMEGYMDELSEIAKESKLLDDVNDALGIDDISSLVVASQLQDTNDILETSLYVSKEKNRPNHVKMITETTQEYTNAMRDTGIIYSPINSARILA